MQDMQDLQKSSETSAQRMFEQYRAKHPEAQSYEAWAYGSVPDELAQLTLRGIKTATASALPEYEAENEPLPPVGNLDIILDSRGAAVCIIRTTRVRVFPFRDVPEEQAYKEGEGDRSLAYWRRVHAAVFSRYLPPLGKTFDEDMPVVCQEFERVWPE